MPIRIVRIPASGPNRKPATGPYVRPDLSRDRRPNDARPIPPRDVGAGARYETPDGEAPRKEAERSRSPIRDRTTAPEEVPYKVGNKRPPKHSQYTEGVSGNPSGRPRRSTSFMADLAEVLREAVKIQENGKTKTVSKRKGMIKRFAAKALNGDDRAFGRLIPFILALERMEQAVDGVDALSPAERKLLKQNAKRLLDDLMREEGDD